MKFNMKEERKCKTKEQIYKEILNEMSDDFTEEEKAAFIMFKISKNRSFSSKYYWTSEENRNKMYELAKNNKLRFKQNKRQLICVTATKLYKDIAERFGLDVYIMGDTEISKKDYSVFGPGEHISPIIKQKMEDL